MNHIKNNVLLNGQTSFYASRIAKISLFIYLFFVFFGTSAPFQEKISSVDDIATSNVINQFVFTFLYILSFIALIPKHQEVLQFIKREKFLTLFLLWSLITVFWSDFTFISFKRWVQIFGTSLISLAYLLYLKPSEDKLLYVKWILMVYLPLTLLSVLLIPAAIQWEFPAWRGMAPHKNLLGQVALVSTIVWLFSLKDRGGLKLPANIFFFLLSLIVIIGAQSTTTFLIGGIITGLIALSIVVRKSSPLKREFYIFSLLFFSIAVIVLIVSFIPDIFETVFGAFGKDLTFTGRIDLWQAIWEEVKNHPFIGRGFGGYWVMDSLHLKPVFDEFVWIPNEAHMGYLDIINETGLIGISLLLLMILSYCSNLYNERRTSPLKWIFFAILILNITESTLFRQNVLTGVLFIFAYIALFTEQINLNSGTWYKLFNHKLY